MPAVGPKKARLIDVAELAGVSPTAVGKVLSGTGGSRVGVGPEAAAQIRRAARELGYRPNAAARQLRGQRSQLVGVLVDSRAPQARLYGLARLESLLRQRRYRILVGYGHDDAEAFREHRDEFISRGVDGLVCLSHDYPDRRISDEVTALVEDSGIPCVLIGRPRFATHRATVIDIDRETAVRQAVRHLHERGRLRPCLVSFASGSQSARAREAGFRRGLEETGLDRAEEPCVLNLPLSAMDRRSDDLGRFVDREVLPRRMDAILAPNDLIAARLLKVLAGRGVEVPGDMALIGWANDPIAELTAPALTTIDQHEETLAELAVTALMRSVETQQEPAVEADDLGPPAAVTPSLVIRESC